MKDAIDYDLIIAQFEADSVIANSKPVMGFCSVNFFNIGNLSEMITARKRKEYKLFNLFSNIGGQVLNVLEECRFELSEHSPLLLIA